MSVSIKIQGVEDTLDEENREFAEVLKTSKDVFEEAFELFNDPCFDNYEGWKKEAETDVATIHTRPMSYGKLFALRATVPWGFENVFQAQWDGLDQVASWNENIVFSSTLKKITDNVDVVHYANKDVFMVKSREYVVGRIWRRVGDTFYLIARSVDFPGLPEDKNRIRGIIHMGAGRYKLHPENPNMTQVDLLLSIDFGGFIPKSIINTVMGKLVIKDFEETRKHLISLKNGTENSN